MESFPISNAGFFCALDSTWVVLNCVYVDMGHTCKESSMGPLPPPSGVYDNAESLRGGG